MATEPFITVTVVVGAGQRDARTAEIRVAPGTSAATAIAKSDVLKLLSDVEIDALQVAIWGRKVQPSHLVRDNDRIELCRPLKVDPKVARRERFQRQGAKSAGLFNKLRAGAKAGY
jgi:putative ubiquitin-RnfH superfamily antitoxin RatB of RatAB toxin-antitoxin module